jgi:hypothetical protein
MQDYATQPADAGSAAAPSGTPLRWPPPGLEPIHGAVWPAITLLGVGGALMTLPMLLAVATSQPFWSMGTFGASWWVPVLCTVAGLVLVLGGVDRLARVLLGAARAVRHGYDLRIIAYVATDGSRDAGFLLQGLRQYASLGERERRWLLNARVAAAAACALALLWIPFGFAVGVMLAGRGVIASGTGLTLFVFLPAAAALLAGIGCRFLDLAGTARIRREWRSGGRADVALDLEAAAWRADLDARSGDASPVGAPARRAPLRAAAWALIVAAALLPLPLLTLSLVSTAGPVTTQIAVPNMARMSTRLAQLEVLRPYLLPTDPAITAQQAGAALHTLSHVGRSAPVAPLELPPVRTYETDWNGAYEQPDGLPPLERFVNGGLFARAQSLTPAERDYLARATAHPAHAEFATLARAVSADVAGTRWDPALLAGTVPWELPIPRFGQLRSGAYHHVARAALQTSRGEVMAAETTLRELISAGFLLAREGVTMIDMLIGAVIADIGASALLEFYEATGRTAEAHSIRHTRGGIETAAGLGRSLNVGSRPDGSMHASMAQAADSTLPRGLRWEALMRVHLSAGCLNPHTAVFGRGTEYGSWLENVRSDLVRYPSEAALFDMTTSGDVIPAQYARRAGLVRRLVGVTLRRDAAGHCATLLTAATASL